MWCPLKEREAKTRQFSRAFIHVAETKWYVLVSFSPPFIDDNNVTLLRAILSRDARNDVRVTENKTRV